MELELEFQTLPLQPLGEVQGCSRRRKLVPLQVLWLLFSSVDHNFKPVEMDAILVKFTLHHFKNVSLFLGLEQCVSLFSFFLLQRENAVWGVNDFMTMQLAAVDHRAQCRNPIISFEMKTNTWEKDLCASGLLDLRFCSRKNGFSDAAWLLSHRSLPFSPAWCWLPEYTWGAGARTKRTISFHFGLL